MDSQKVDMYLMVNAKYFHGHHLNYIRERLLLMDESRWLMLQGLDLKDPGQVFIVSLMGSSAGIDRFVIGDTGLGVGKLLTCGGFGIWAIIDWFLIMDATRQKNMEKIQQVL